MLGMTVIVMGAGFAGLYAAIGLSRRFTEVVRERLHRAQLQSSKRQIIYVVS